MKIIVMPGKSQAFYENNCVMPEIRYFPCMDNIANKKDQLRQQARRHRAAIDKNSHHHETIIGVFFQHVEPKQEQKIALYWPVGSEFDTRFLLDELHHRGFTCLLPKIIDGTRILDFIRWTPQTAMIAGAHGILTPDSAETHIPDIILAPLLAFDQKGNRLGQGGGYYDATVAHLRAQKEVLFYGIAYAEQAVLLPLPAESHDQPMDGIITPDDKL